MRIDKQTYEGDVKKARRKVALFANARLALELEHIVANNHYETKAWREAVLSEAAIRLRWGRD
jgi:hypothetical protein